MSYYYGVNYGAVDKNLPTYRSENWTRERVTADLRNNKFEFSTTKEHVKLIVCVTGAGLFIGGLLFGGIFGGIHASIPHHFDLGIKLFIGFGSVAGAGVVVMIANFVAFRHFGKQAMTSQEFDALEAELYRQVEYHKQSCQADAEYGKKCQARADSLQLILDKKKS